MQAQRELTVARVYSLGAAIACTSIMGMATGLAWTLLSLRLERQGYDSAAIGVNAAAQSLGILAAAFLAPAATARFGLVRSCAAAALLVLAMMLLLPLLDGYVAWLPLRFLLGAGSTFLFIAGETWIVQVGPPRYRGRIVGVLGLAWGGMFALGPAVVGIAGAEGWLPFLIGAAAALLAALPLAFVGEVPATPATRSRLNMAQLLRRSPATMLALVVLGMIDSSHDSLLPIYGLRLGLDQSTAVFMLTAVLAGITLVQLPFGWVAGHVDRKRLLRVCVASACCLTVALGLTATAPLLRWPVLLLLGACIGGLWASSLTLIGDEFGPDQVADANAARALLYGAAAMVGPMLSGAAMELWQPHGLIVVLALIWLLYLPFTRAK